MNMQVNIIDGPLSKVAHESGDGAILHFEGVVRATEDGRPIRGLQYTLYEPMAQKQLRQLAGEAVERFGVSVVDVQHSRGFVAVGQCSLRIRISSPHRKEALAAMDWFIDQLKRDVPIWKQPVYVEALAASAVEPMEPTR